MQQVPLKPVPSQTLQVILGTQICQLTLYQRTRSLYMDVAVAGTLIIGGVACQNLNRIVRSVYLGFSGDFMFLDNQGSDDPYYTGLGERFWLIYLTPAELGGLG